MSRRRPIPIRGKRTWVLPWFAVIVGAFGTAFFHHFCEVSRPSVGTSPDAPFVRLELGADLWTFTDSNLLDHTPRRFPNYSVEALESRNILEVSPVPLRNEILILAPSERFLAEEFIRKLLPIPGEQVTPGPVLCKTGLTLVLSEDTKTQILRSAGYHPRTLLDWVKACHAASQPNHPISLYMANPEECSSSWLGLVELVAEALGNLDENQLQLVSADQLAQAVHKLGSEIKVGGNSDRLEMYKLLLGRYPAGAVLLVYDHLAMPLLSGNARNFTVVRPEQHFDSVVQTIIISKIPNFQANLYLPSLLKSWAAVGLAQPDTFNTSKGSRETDVGRVPDYMTMKRVLDAWNFDQSLNRNQ